MKNNLSQEGLTNKRETHKAGFNVKDHYYVLHLPANEEIKSLLL